MKPLQRAKKKLCFEIAELILKKQQQNPKTYDDIESVARLIELRLPLTYAEAQEEWDSMEEKTSTPILQKPSRLTLIREAIGSAADGLNLGELLDLVIIKLQERK